MIPRNLSIRFLSLRILKSSKALKSFNTVSNSNLIYSSLVECNGNVDSCNSLSTKLTWVHYITSVMYFKEIHREHQGCKYVSQDYNMVREGQVCIAD